MKRFWISVSAAVSAHHDQHHLQGQSGDDKDWGSGTNDSFNAFSFSGVANVISAVDVREMDVIGYNTVPEPSSFLLCSVGGAGFLMGYRRKGSANRLCK